MHPNRGVSYWIEMVRHERTYGVMSLADGSPKS